MSQKLEEYILQNFPGVLPKKLVDVSRQFRERFGEIDIKINEQQIVVFDSHTDDRIREAIKEYRKFKEKPLTPAAVTKYWRTIWQVNSEIMNMQFDVPDCDWPEPEMNGPMADIRDNPVQGMMIYKPPEVEGTAGIRHLALLYERIYGEGRGHLSVPSIDFLTEPPELSGWLKVEAVHAAPNADTTESQLHEFKKIYGYGALGPVGYTVASEDIYRRTGRRFDEQTFDADGTVSRLLDTQFIGPQYYGFFEKQIRKLRGDLQREFTTRAVAQSTPAGIFISNRFSIAPEYGQYVDENCHHPKLGARFGQTKPT